MNQNYGSCLLTTKHLYTKFEVKPLSSSGQERLSKGENSEVIWVELQSLCSALLGMWTNANTQSRDYIFPLLESIRHIKKQHNYFDLICSSPRLNSVVVLIRIISLSLKFYSNTYGLEENIVIIAEKYLLCFPLTFMELSMSEQNFFI